MDLGFCLFECVERFQGYTDTGRSVLPDASFDRRGEPTRCLDLCRASSACGAVVTVGDKCSFGASVSPSGLEPASAFYTVYLVRSNRVTHALADAALAALLLLLLWHALRWLRRAYDAALLRAAQDAAEAEALAAVAWRKQYIDDWRRIQRSRRFARLDEPSEVSTKLRLSPQAARGATCHATCAGRRGCASASPTRRALYAALPRASLPHGCFGYASMAAGLNVELHGACL